MKRKKNTKKRKRNTAGRKNHSKAVRSMKQKGQDLYLAVFLGIVSTLIVCSFFFTVVKVTGHGMIPTLRNEEYVVVKKTKEVTRFGLVAFYGQRNKKQIRRLIGLPGEMISFKEDHLLVNGEPVDENFIVDEVNESQRAGREYTEDFTLNALLNLEGAIPKDMYLVLGDNRPYTTDSRHYGLIRKEKLIGLVLAGR